MGKWPRGIPTALDIRSLRERAKRGDREAFIGCMKHGLYRHATADLHLSMPQALDLVGQIDWAAVRLEVRVE